MSTAEKIKKYIREHGIKSTIIIERTGMSEQAVYSTLAGKRKLTADEFIEICKALEVSTEIFSV